MAKHGKNYNKAIKVVGEKVAINPIDAIVKLKEAAYSKFDESVDVDVNLGIDSTKGDQVVRGAISLPHGIGKQVKIIAFAKGEHADKARAAGADLVGDEDLVEKVLSGWVDFDYAVATPDLMGLVGKTAKILGPKGLLPNAKNGTVTFSLDKIIPEIKKGKVFFKNDKSGLVHSTIGKVSFSPEMLEDNFKAFIKALVASKPASSKGKYLKKVTLTSTMGPGIPVVIEDSLRF